MGQNRQIRLYIDTLRKAWGSQHWWPAESAFEVIVGAILTQNTAWGNVEKALVNLRAVRAISVEAIREIPLQNLERLVQPAGFFRQKAARLKLFVEWLDGRYDGSLDKMFSEPTLKLRGELLGLNGIGPETADSILLYAGQHEIFVVDAYTRRIFERHGIVTSGAKYDNIRQAVEGALQMPGEHGLRTKNPPPSLAMEPGPGPAEETPIPTVHSPTRMSEAPRSALAQDYNELHALIVQVGKHFCLSRAARCEECPLRMHLSRTAKVTRSKGRRQRAARKT